MTEREMENLLSKFEIQELMRKRCEEQGHDYVNCWCEEQGHDYVNCWFACTLRHVCSAAFEIYMRCKWCGQIR